MLMLHTRISLIFLFVLGSVIKLFRLSGAGYVDSPSPSCLLHPWYFFIFHALEIWMQKKKNPGKCHIVYSCVSTVLYSTALIWSWKSMKSWKSNHGCGRNNPISRPYLLSERRLYFYNLSCLVILFQACKNLYRRFISCLFTLREFVALCGWGVTIQHYEIPHREAGERQVQRNRIRWSPFCSAGAETACMVVC